MDMNHCRLGTQYVLRQPDICRWPYDLSITTTVERRLTVVLKANNRQVAYVSMIRDCPKIHESVHRNRIGSEVVSRGYSNWRVYT